MMEPQMGTEVKDKNGKLLGTIDYIVRDSWSGDVRKYLVYRKPPEEDISFSPEEIAANEDTSVTLNIEAA